MTSFKTQSSSRKSVLTMVFTFIPMFALAFLGLRIAVVTWLFLEAMLLLSFGFCVFLSARTYWEMAFQGSRIFMYNRGNRQSYVFEDLTQRDFLIRQSARQKEKNTCDLQIRECAFRFYDVQNHSQLLAYIQENFSE